MAGPAVPLIGLGILALVLMGGSKSGATLPKTPEQIKADAFKQGSLDGANDCANKLPKKIDPTVAAKTGNPAAYADGYNAGWAKACGADPGPTTYTCITSDAGMTLSAAQLAYVKLKYSIGDIIGTCGASTVAATKSFQTGNALPITGIIDKATAQKLAAKASAGDTVYSEIYDDTNGIAWRITNPGAGTFRGVPIGDYPLLYNGQRVDAPTTDLVKAGIMAFAASVAGAVATAGRRGRNGSPHTPLARAIGTSPMSGRPLGGGQFPSYSYYM